MAIPVARVHLAVAHAALPALLPIPPKCEMLPLLPTPCVAVVLPKPLAKPSRADSDERWDARKTMTGLASSTIQSSASSSPRSTSADSVRSSAQRRGSSCKSATAPPKPGRADSAVRWDAHKKVAIPASSSSSSSSSGTSSHASSSAERWDVHKKHRPPQATELLDDSKSSTGSNDIDTDQEDIVWKPWVIYAEPGFVSVAPEPSMLPMPTAFLLRVA